MTSAAVESAPAGAPHDAAFAGATLAVLAGAYLVRLEERRAVVGKQPA